MATTVKSIVAAGGADYTTIASWEGGAPTMGTDIWKGEIDDNSAYDEAINFTVSGTTSLTSYLWLTGGASNRHAGIEGTGHPRIDYSGGNAQVIWLAASASYSRIEWLELTRSDMGTNERVIFVDSCSDVLLDYCIFTHSDSTPGNGGSAVYGDDSDHDLCLSNSVLYAFPAAALRVSQWNTTDRTIVYNVDHCSFVNNGQNNHGTSSNFAAYMTNAGDSITLNTYNTSWVGTIYYPEIRVQVLTGSATITGSHNARTDSSNLVNWDTDSTSNWQDASDGAVDTAPGTAGAYFTDLTDWDLTPVEHANNVLMGNGTNRQGSEPDSRQDFSVAINGARDTSNIDIGGFQVTTGSTTLTASVLSEAPSFPTPTVSLNLDLTVSVLSVTPSFATPVASAGDVALTSAILSVTPSFPTPSVSPGAVTLTVAVLSITPSFPTPSVTPDTFVLTVAVLSVSPSFPSPTVSAGAVTLTAAVLSVTPSFETPTVSYSINLQPSVLSVTPSFPGVTAAGILGLTVPVLSVSPTFPTPEIATAGLLLVSVLTVTPSFEVPTLTSVLELTPSVLSITPTFPALAVYLSITVSLLDVAPNFPTVTISNNLDLVPDSISVSPVFDTVTIAEGATIVEATEIANLGSNSDHMSGVYNSWWSGRVGKKRIGL